MCDRRGMPERQAFRERIRLEAAERFTAGAADAEAAKDKDLRASVRSVRRRAWYDARTEGLRSAGPMSRPKLSEALLTVLEQELAKAPVPHEHDAVGDRADAARTRFQPPGPGPPGDRARRGGRGGLGEGDPAAGGRPRPARTALGMTVGSGRAASGCTAELSHASEALSGGRAHGHRGATSASGECADAGHPAARVPG